jgi:predicted nucleic acid-binding protein
VPNFFLDTSALAKLYHKEPGSDYVQRLVNSTSGNQIFISSLSLIEMESMFAIKVRDRKLSLPDLDKGQRRFRADLASSRLGVLAFNEHHFNFARSSIVQYGIPEGLRTLDALQLSMAMHLLNSGLLTAMVAADRTLCRVAMLCNCPVIDPQSPPP